MKKTISLLLALITAFTAINLTAFAQEFTVKQPDICSFTYKMTDDLKYDFEFLGSRKKLISQSDKLEKVVVYIENTGTIPFYSEDSGCSFRPIARLGTERDRDRESIFYTPETNELETGWVSANRIKLDQKVVKPQEKGSFTFYVKAPEDNALYREYFDIVLEGKKWMEKPFAVNFDIGTYMSEKRDYIKYVNSSRRVGSEDLNGEKSIEVSIAEQKMILKVGDLTIREFPVSTGKWSTPTPYGYTQISHKQDVRVAGAWPHYIMPKWQTFRGGGYGIHALPSLSFDNGYFWTEALNHIGTRRSHGCIRLLPEDANFTYDFTDIGTKVWVR